ncbi:Molybdate transport system regulatory protein [human gut metagenome]|uniref:Molybdate transport system regulatory protein n=1 Tax=human gut metagenome TaxID=408170 RepID=W1Y3L8_9ZZZZ
MIPQRAMYSLDEVAEMLGLSINPVRRWRSLGRLRVVKVGRSVRVPADEVERLRHARRRR